jgi:putative nucleotidyltransferase with HDIG domain
MVVVTGIGLAGYGLVRLVMAVPSMQWHTRIAIVTFLALGVIAERMIIPLVSYERNTVGNTVGSVPFIAAIVVLPWYAAIVVSAAAIAIAQLRRPPLRTIFNAGFVSLSVGAGSAVLLAFGGQTGLLSDSPAEAGHALVTMLAVGATYYVTATGIVAIMVAFVAGEGVWQTYRSNQRKTILQEATSIGLGFLFAGFCLYNLAFVPFVALPVIMAYFSIETLVRIQEETRHSVLAMSESIDHRDPLTYNHSKRVAQLSVALAEEIGLSHGQLSTIELSALVHDIGKIGISSDILMKPGKLTSEERAQMELHPVIGYDMLKHYKQFREGLGIVRWHHEAWDGNGYPDHLKGTGIPLEARIVAIADAFEAMTADRPYREAMDWSVAMERLEQASGTQFDPNLVPSFRVACERIGEAVPQGPSPADGPQAVPASKPIVSPGVKEPSAEIHRVPVRPTRSRPVIRPASFLIKRRQGDADSCRHAALSLPDKRVS